MKDLTKNRWKFVLIPALIVIAGIVLYIVHGGFNFDVEFMGGIRMQVNMHTDFDNKEVADLIQEKTVDTVSAKVQTGDNPQVAVIKTPPVDETVKTEIFNALKDKYNLSDDDLLSVSSASASFGNEIQRKALLYTLLAIICILIYIAIRFEWRSAIMAVIALAINVLIMAAIYAITNIPLNTNFIAAIRMVHVLLFECLASSYEIGGAALRGLGYSMTPAVLTVLGSCVFRLIWIYTVFNKFRSFEMLMNVYPVSWVITGIAVLIAYAMVRKKLFKET